LEIERRAGAANSHRRNYFEGHMSGKNKLWLETAAATRLVGLALLMLAANLSAQPQPGMVAAAFKDPSQEWKDYPTRTLEDLSAAVRDHVDSGLTSYGGLLGRKDKATGFFHTTKRDGRWWLVDPNGNLFLARGIASTTPLRTVGAKAAFEEKFGSETNWATRTTALLREHGFTGVGAWSDTEALRSVSHPLVYTRVLDFMGGYGRKRGGTYSQPGHTGYPGDCIFVFDPDFETFCDEHAKALAARKDDPYLIGYFSDNELPFRPASLSNYLALPAKDFGNQAALAWLRARQGAQATGRNPTAQDQRDFLEFVVERYFSITSRAIRKYDPNHLFLGSRFYGSDLSQPEMFKAAGRYLDIVSVNYYHAWSPDGDRLAMWERESGKPVLITEWYAKGMDSGLANHGGAGWVVKTQRDRGRFYENFTLGLLESRVCVGWDWFKYADNDPGETGADLSNRDSNKGILSNRYEPYEPLLEAMKRINERTYSLVEYFDGQSPSRVSFR
jgi:hypothetical protein